MFLVECGRNWVYTFRLLTICNTKSCMVYWSHILFLSDWNQEKFAMNLEISKKKMWTIQKTLTQLW